MLGYLEGARADGGQRLQGGKQVAREGYFLEPTVVTEARTDSSKFMAEEVFGPVAKVVRFSSIAEVIAQSNDSRLRPGGRGLDPGRQQGPPVAAALKAGTVWVNCYNVFDTALPFGGYKQSGWAPRELPGSPRPLHRDEDRLPGAVIASPLGPGRCRRWAGDRRAGRLHDLHRSPIPGLRIERPIHESFRTVVYRATRARGRRTVAVKCPRSEYPSRPDLARFRNEFEVTRSISSAAVIRPDRLGTLGSRTYLVLALLRGRAALAARWASRCR